MSQLLLSPMVVLRPTMLDPSGKKGRISPSQHVLSFLALSFHFLHFIHGSTIGFSVKNERLITVKKKREFQLHIYFLCCISSSIYFLRKGSKNLKGVMIVVVRSYWQDCTSPKIKSMGGFFNFSIEMKRVFLGKKIYWSARAGQGILHSW